MQKKLKSVKSSDAQQIVATVRNNAQQVWLAGLGAFAAVQTQGNKALNKAQSESARVFAALVKQGQQIETRAKQAAVNRLRCRSGHRKPWASLSKYSTVFRVP
jgi:hypothetical protein